MPVFPLELLGKAAYLAYRESVGGISAISGDPLPMWEQCPPVVREGWRAAADAVLMMASLGR